LITSNQYIRAFKAGLSGFAVHPSALQGPSTLNAPNTNHLQNDSNESKVSHLTQSLNNYLYGKLSKHDFNSSVLNSTSITSQEATEKFIEQLQKMTNIAFQDISYLKVDSTIFGNNSSYYQSFHHLTANNYLQESLLTLADSISHDDETFSALKNSANQLLQSYGLPISQNSASDILWGMSQLLNTQLSNIGHLVDIKA